MSGKKAVFEIKIDRYNHTPEQWEERLPVNITCAILALEDQEPIIHLKRKPSGAIAHHLDIPQVKDFIQLLHHTQQQGYQLFSWNGTSFDLQVMADVTETHQKCADLAVRHRDLMFQVFCNMGWPVGLHSACQGMTIEHMELDSETINEHWETPEHRPDIVNLAVNDARATLEVAAQAEADKLISWYSRSGNRYDLTLPNGPLTVGNALFLPKPDQSWMHDPLTRGHFTRWFPHMQVRSPPERPTAGRVLVTKPDGTTGPNPMSTT